jgi:CheY-like chemotaxis protein
MKNTRILITEDDTISREVMAKLLQSCHYETCSCTLAEEAIARIKQEPFNILITDLQMPEMDGFELIRNVRMIHPEILTIMITGFSTDEIRCRAKAEGIDGFFSKPVEWDELYTLLDNLSESVKTGNQNMPSKAGNDRRPHLSRGIVFALIFLLFAVFDANPSKAQPPFHLQNRPMLKAEGPEACWQSSDLALTETQIKSLGGLRSDYAVETMPLRRELFSLRFELRHLIRDPNVDPRVLLDRQKKISDLQAKLDNLSFSYQIKGRSILTREQLEQLPRDCSLELEAVFGTGAGMSRGPRRGR